MARDTEHRTVFISYVQADRAWAEWIADHLREVGVEAVTGADELMLGSALVDAIRTQIAKSDTVLVLLSDRANASAWVSAEVALAKATGKDLVGILVEDGAPIPADLLETEIVQLAGTSLDSARARLRRVFESLRSYDVTEPDIGSKNAAPPSPPRAFVNRKQELDLLKAALVVPANAEPATVVITGMGGIGKTALATEFVHRHRDSFREVHWVQAGERSQQLRPDEVGPGDLVVIDDAEDYQGVAELLQKFALAHVLILSRKMHWGRPFQVICLGAFDQAASRSLVRQLAPGASDEEMAKLTSVASGVPLAINMIASMAQAHARPLGDVLSELETFEATFVSPESSRGYYFLDTDDPRLISSFERALEDVLEVRDEPVDLHDRSRGSWRGWWRRRYTPERVEAMADKAERAVEVAALTKPEGEANRNHAEAVARLIESTAGIPNLVVIAGSVLLVKVTDTSGPRVVSKTLTATELRRFEERDELLSDPARALEFLQNREPPASQLGAAGDGAADH